MKPTAMVDVGMLIFIGLTLTACSSAVDGPVDQPTSPTNPVDEGDPSAVLYAPDRLLRVDIELPTTDWDALRLQERNFVQMFMGECLAQPFPKPFTWFEATVTVDGQQLQKVGVRKKGFAGSLDVDKPSLKLKFDRFVKGQRLLSLSRLTLNNAVQDPSLLRQCLGYRVYGLAGIPAPRCNFAQVRVNGESLGVYVNVEPIKKDFLARHYDSPHGNLYEGTLSDFRDGWTGTFEVKTGSTSADLTEVHAIRKALQEPDELLVSTLEQTLDLNQFLTVWATDVLLGHWDGYAGNTNNFFIYTDPNRQRVQFIPWGIDTIMENVDEANPTMTTGLLARRLYAIALVRQRYAVALKRVLDESWHEQHLLEYLNRVRETIGSAAQQDPNFSPQAFEQVVDFVKRRRSILTATLSDPLPDSNEELRPKPCYREAGYLEVRFSTTWGTLGDDPLNSGSATMTGQWLQTDLGQLEGGAIAGYGEGQTIIAAGGLDDNGGETYLCLMRIPTAALKIGTWDWSTLGAMGEFIPNPEDPDDRHGVLGPGKLIFDQISTQPGQILEGRFTGSLMVQGW